MRVVLKELTPFPLSVGERANSDFFNIEGHLIVAKGQRVTPKVYKILLTDKVYSIHYELEPTPETGQFSTQLYKQQVRSVEYFFTQAQLFDSAALTHTLSLMEGISREPKNKNILFELDRLRTFDNSTYIHSVNVAIISGILGRGLGLKEQSLRTLILGALLHDIGKMTIPHEVLNKPQALTTAEFELIQMHPLFGIEHLQKILIPESVKQAISQHHERWNGKGYPNKLRKHEISLEGQIVALADVFDALTADRPYRKGIPPYHAFEMILSGSGIDFSPEVVETFKRFFIVYPLNTLVKLNNGQTGMVIAVPKERPTRPLLRILKDQQGKSLDSIHEVDLLKESSLNIVEVEYT